MTGLGAGASWGTQHDCDPRTALEKRLPHQVVAGILSQPPGQIEGARPKAGSREQVRGPGLP